MNEFVFLPHTGYEFRGLLDGPEDHEILGCWIGDGILKVFFGQETLFPSGFTSCQNETDKAAICNSDASGCLRRTLSRRAAGKRGRKSRFRRDNGIFYVQPVTQ